MFINNKYTKWYFNIINSAKNKKFFSESYYENHHIIPKSLGGDNSKQNLVKLTAREHFICHLLLVKMLSDKSHIRSMSYALLTMTRSNGGGRRNSITSRQFENAKRLILPYISGENNWMCGKTGIYCGNKNPMYGKPCYYNMTEDQKQNWKKNISLAMVGEKNPFYGKTHTKDIKERISKQRSIPIKVKFFNGEIQFFDQFGDLGEYLGKSRALGSKLCKPKFKYLLQNYNIESITRLK